MLVSAPFDDWWHNAYGLDVRIISPPHMVLAAGFFGIEFGTIMLLLAFMNRAGDDRAAGAAAACFCTSAASPSASRCSSSSNTSPGPTCTRRSSTSSSCLGTLGILTAVAVASRQRWACTIMAAVYTAFGVAFLWILPLFPAEPKLGPVYRQITHFIPWEFPLLLIVPAFAMDLIFQRTDGLAADRSRAGRGRGVSRRLRRRAVAVRRFPDDAARAQLGVRHGLHGLRHARAIALRAVRVSCRRKPPRSSGAGCSSRRSSPA